MHNCSESRSVAHDIETNAVHSELHGHFFLTIITANMNPSVAVCLLFLQGPLTGTLTLRVSSTQLAAADTQQKTVKVRQLWRVDGWVSGDWMGVGGMMNTKAIFCVHHAVAIDLALQNYEGTRGCLFLAVLNTTVLSLWPSLQSATSTPLVQNGL